MYKEEEILLALSRIIDSDSYQVGMRLSPERELSAQLNVSRNTLRAALKTLQARGIIEIRGSSGSYIVSRPASADRVRAANQGTSMERLESFFEARRHFDPIIVALSIRRMDAEDIKKLKLCLISLSQAIMQNRPDAVVAHDTSFRRILATGTKNSSLMEMIDILQLPAESIPKLFASASEEDKDMLFAGYVELFHALRDRDASSAEKASESLLDNLFALLSANDQSNN